MYGAVPMDIAAKMPQTQLDHSHIVLSLNFAPTPLSLSAHTSSPFPVTYHGVSHHFCRPENMLVLINSILFPCLFDLEKNCLTRPHESHSANGKEALSLAYHLMTLAGSLMGEMTVVLLLQ